LSKHTRPEGVFWTLLLDTELTQGFYQYKYKVTFTDGSVRKVTDPCARYSGSEQQNSGFVIVVVAARRPTPSRYPGTVDKKTREAM
jgi:1,4-alpha-glucan branching enzyme